ncbi:unnamed protein product, partial [Amoebophrya sp. A120]
ATSGDSHQWLPVCAVWVGERLVASPGHLHLPRLSGAPPGSPLSRGASRHWLAWLWRRRLAFGAARRRSGFFPVGLANSFDFWLGPSRLTARSFFGGFLDTTASGAAGGPRPTSGG